MSEKKIDLFFPEEDKMIEYIKEYAENFGESHSSLFIGLATDQTENNESDTHITNKHFTI